MTGRALQKYRVCTGRFYFSPRFILITEDTDMRARAAVRQSTNSSASEQVGWKKGGILSDEFWSIFSPLSHSLNESSVTSGAQFEAMTDMLPLGGLRWHQQERKYRKAQWIESLPSSFCSLSLAITHRYSCIKMDKTKKQKTLKQDRLEFEQFSFLARLYLSISIRLLLRLIAPPSLHWRRTQPWAELIKCF